ncbi:hypothetical protein [uncultured Limosilactobacillus sp.]|uniref:hypothetical protein n=1 Tax=uncultured Limosilactobacillus sp. TaxID=2837629 RepID=UPI0025DC39F3|nr:hypothetical protein [uncultured Limosilactobacillus sp.]
MKQHDDWWVVKDPTKKGTVATIGFRNDRLKEWGQLLFLDLPNVGAFLDSGDFFVSIEATREITFSAAPVGGQVIAINPLLNGWVDHQATGSEWLLKLLIQD